MPTKKQIRRQQKLKRHEYEEVYVDEEGRELDPEEAAESDRRDTARPRRRKPSGSSLPRAPAALIDPPSLRRTVRRGLLFFPLMLVTVILLGNNLTLTQQIAQTVVLMAFFLPFSDFMDTMVYRSYQKRMARDAPKKP